MAQDPDRLLFAGSNCGYDFNGIIANNSRIHKLHRPGYADYSAICCCLLCDNKNYNVFPGSISNSNHGDGHLRLESDTIITVMADLRNSGIQNADGTINVGLANNNPGDIKYDGTAWLGEVGNNCTFVTFSD